MNHQILGEGDVVQAVQTQMQTNRNLYDGYINDSDFIGTHSRLQSAVNLTDWMAGEGKDVTNPGLDLNDFMGMSFTTGPDGKLWQLPDQQFANLYWFRKDWFDRPDLKEKFKAKYGYELGVPVNWSAYEDIADFFTNDVKEIDGVKVYGHMDYGKRAPDLGWRMTDAWLSMAGEADPGLPNGRPVDEWGIRMEKDSCNPGRRFGVARWRRQQPGGCLCRHQVGRMAAEICPSGCGRPRLLPVAAVARARATWPSRSSGTRPLPPRWWRRRATATTRLTTRACRCGAWRRRRMAPTGKKARSAAIRTWVLDAVQLHASRSPQGGLALLPSSSSSKTVDVKKSHVGLTFIRDSTVRDKSFTERAPKLGGLIEFYRSPDRVAWTPTGVNVPDYPKLAQLFWENIGDVNSGAFTAQQAMDRLAEQMDRSDGPHGGGRQGQPYLP